ncbi:hypothetical protein SEA_LUCKYSOCKE_4 [Streptomyces phage LuckySocke]|nr:hypothetical protein SEA_ALONE_5 [Streptomyces phage Alone3]WPH59034.1 hypothetical protein SEA_LUCKYSOCKE_4 [Streptomyces phage LuckySocke]
MTPVYKCTKCKATSSNPARCPDKNCDGHMVIKRGRPDM